MTSIAGLWRDLQKSVAMPRARNAGAGIAARALAGAALATAIVGCGQKGPLTLPKAAPAASPASAASAANA